MMQVDEMVQMTRELMALFKQVEPREWDATAMATELNAETGTLSDTIMIKEGYRHLRPGTTLDLEDDIVDVMFMLIRIALHYDIDIEAAYRQMVEETRAKIKKRIEAD